MGTSEELDDLHWIWDVAFTDLGVTDTDWRPSTIGGSFWGSYQLFEMRDGITEGLWVCDRQNTWRVGKDR